MHLSIVIPTFNRARLLADTVPALANQRLEVGITYDVTFVSNGSTDSTAQVLEGAMEKYPGRFRYFRIEPTGGPSAPRNFGIRAAQGDVIIILDDDVLPEPDMVVQFAAFHRQHPGLTAAAIGEAYVPARLQSDPMSAFHTFPYDALRKLDRLTYLHFWTCMVSLKRQFMLVHGMFDESFLYYEDVLCGHQLEAHGMELHFWPGARGEHLHQMTSAGLPAKGLFLGRWLWPFLERIPDPAAMERFGVISTKLPWRTLVRRCLGRAWFRIADNPGTAAILRWAGATQPIRSRASDFYYGLIFRRHMLAGYDEARRHAAAGKKLNLTQVDSTLANRGDD